jgi:hypothetical protein
MKVHIAPILGRTFSSLISLTYGPILNIKEADVLDYCQKMGEVYAGYVDDEMVCCWGLIPPSFLSMEAYLWMWCAGDAVTHHFVFIRQSQIQVRRMLERYETINGHCKLGNRRAMRWLKWLGAEFADYPEDGRLTFTIRRA